MRIPTRPGGWYEDARGAVRSIRAKERASEIGREIHRLRKRKAEALSPAPVALLPEVARPYPMPTWREQDQVRLDDLLQQARALEAEEAAVAQQESERR